MTSEECRLLIPQYLSGQLTALERQLFEQQLEVDHELRLEVEELSSLWEGLGTPQKKNGRLFPAQPLL